jgi:DNA-binding response OmpR family regulator
MPGDQYTILIVDDDEVFCENESSLLRSSGFRVISTTTPDECLSLLEREKVDLVLLDYRYRNTTGLELYARIKEKHTIPVIIVSAYCDPLIEDQFYSMGGKFWIHKPFKTRELVLAIHALFTSARRTQ